MSLSPGELEDKDHQGEAGALSLNGFALNGCNFG